MSRVEDAWQGALAAEQQAVFGYALLGPHVATAEDAARARDCADAHARLRNATAAAIAAAGRTPREPEADYPDLYPVTDADSARRLAARLEHDAAAAWRYLYAAAAETTGARATTLRSTAQAALTGSAVRAVQWRGTPVPFPGI